MTAQIQVEQIRVLSGRFINYCYLVSEPLSQHGVLIDPAWDESKIEEVIYKSNVRLRAILLTHGHFDHVNLARHFSQRFKIPVYAHLNDIVDFAIGSERLNPLTGDTVLRLGALSIKVLYTPGHTSGSCCFIAGDNIFTGDTLFLEGCGICDTRNNGCHSMYGSLQRIKQEVARDTMVYPGHAFSENSSAEFCSVMRTNVYLQIADVDTFSRFRTRPLQTGLYNFR
jgi:hydroxyacylglutathione hydrolase